MKRTFLYNYPIIFRLFLLLIIFSNFANAQLSGTYIIGSSTSANYSNFAGAVNALRTQGVFGPVVFNVESGTYNEQISISPITGASDTNTITFQSVTGDSTDVILSYNSTMAQNNHVLKLNGADHIIIRKITVKALSTLYSNVIVLLNNADSNVIENNVLESSGSNINSSVIYSVNTGNVTNPLSNDQYNKILNNLILNGGYGINLKGVSTTNREKGILIEGNIISNFRKYGIWVNRQEAIKIRSNIVENSTVSTIAYGIYVYNSSLKTEIIENKVHIRSTGTTASQGIMLRKCDGNSSNRGKIINNFVFQSVGNSFWGIIFKNSSYQDFFYNTVNVSYGGTNGKALSVKDGGSNNNFINNNLVNNGGGYTIYMLDINAVQSSDYNNLYSSGSYLAKWDTTNCINLTSWRASSNKGVYSVSANPSFLGSNNYHVNSTALDSAAIPISGITTDLDGQTRNSIKPDIGADEFTLVTVEDAGITALVSPGTPCSGVNSNVIVKLKNFSASNLNTVTINWSINDTIKTSVNFNGTLGQNQDTNILIGSYKFYLGNSYDIKAWTSNPNGKSDTNHNNDTLFVIDLTAGRSGTFTIGGASANFQSFNAAINSLKSGVCGPVVFKIDSGTYNEQININEITGASSTNTITFESTTLDSADVIITYAASSSSNNYVIRLNGADYFTFRNITIQASGSTYARAVVIENQAENNKFLNNIVAGITVSTDSSQYAVIYSSSTIDNNNHIKNNKILYGSIGILIEESAITEKGNQITNNEIDSFNSYGIKIFGQYCVIIKGNSITTITTSPVWGIYSYHCDDSTKIIKNKVNVSSSSTCYGFEIKAGRVSNKFRFLIANNFAIASGTSTYGIAITTVDRVDIFYNSVNVIANTNIDGRGFYLKSNFPSYRATLKNNILVNTGGGYAIEVEDTGYIKNSNYNNFYVTGLHLGKWGTTNCTNLSVWKTNSGRDNNSLSLIPYFNSTSDLHISTPYLNSKGTPVSVLDDIDNEPRNSSTPDIGADEFIPPLSDIGIYNLIEPVVPCSGIPINLKINLRNFGLDTLFTTTINWSVTDTIQSPYNFNDTLAPNRDTNITIGTYTFYNYKTYNLKFWTISPNGKLDGNANNDTFFVYGKQTGLKGAYTIGGTNPDFATFNSAVNMLNIQGVCSTVVFNIIEGTYYEQVRIGDVPGASPINTITFKPDTSNINPVILSHVPTSLDSNYTLRFDGTAYTTVTDLRIQTGNNSSYYATVIDFKGENKFLSLDGNIILGQNSSSTGSYKAVIHAHGFYDNFAHDITIINNEIKYGSTAINLRGCTNYRYEFNNVIKNNKLEYFNKFGINANLQNSVVIDNNEIISKMLGTTQYGIYAMQNKGSFRIINNKLNINVLSGTNFGIYVSHSHGSVHNNALIANNFISQIYGSGTIWGIRTNCNSDLDIFYNTINITAGNSSSAALNVDNYIPTPGFSYTDVNIQNNIAVNTGGGWVVDITNAAVVRNSVSSFDYNNLYKTGASLGRYGINTYGDLTSWQTGTYLDNNSISKVADFISSTDLHLKNYDSFALLHPISRVPKDIDGHYRNTIKPIIGADEKDPIPVDAGIWEITNPVSMICEGINPIEITVMNYGTSLLDTVIINWSINGIRQAPDTLVDSLVFNAQKSVILGYDTFYSDSDYVIIVSVDVPNGLDSNTYNDVDSISNFAVLEFPVLLNIPGDTICPGNNVTMTASSNTGLVFWYDSLIGGERLSKDSVFTSGVLYNNATYYVEIGTIGLPDSIKTSSLLDGMEMGNMFNIIALTEDIVIDSFMIQPNTKNSFLVEVYYKIGTYIGFETDTSAWVLLDTQTVYPQNKDNFTTLSIGGFEMETGDTIALYITSKDISAMLNNTYGINTYSDNKVLISSGTSNFYPFDSLFDSATWNGKIYYSTGSLCNSGRIPVNIVVIDTPNVDLGTDTAICTGDRITIDGGNVPYYSYTWRVLPNPAIISTNHSITVGTQGVYHVVVNSYCGFSGSDTITLSNLPLPDADAGIDRLVCYKDTVTLTASGGVFYIWDKFDSTQNLVFIALDTHEYIVTVYDSNWCFDYDTVLVLALPLPLADAGPDTIVCYGETVTLSATGGDTYYWSTAESTQSINIIASDTIEYFVTVYDLNNCFADDTIVVFTKPLPIVDLGNDSTLIYNRNESMTLDAGSGFENYLWSDASTGQSIIVDTSAGLGMATYWVIVSKNECEGGDTIIISFEDNSGINVIDNQIFIKLYPNPSDGLIYILVEGLKDELNILISNSRGQLILNRIINLPQTIHTIDLSEHGSGIYYIRLLYRDNLFGRKLILR